MASKVINFLEYFKYLKNPIQCLFFKFGLKKNVVIKFKNSDYETELSDVNDINRIMTFIEDVNDYEGYCTYLKNIKSNNNTFSVTNNILIYNPRIYPLNSIFLEYFTDYYSNFDIDYENKIIIDIGANSGDSCLFFSSKGAKVYGFEPVKELYNMALKNIELNKHLKDNIEIYNNAVSYKSGTISINSMDSVSDYISNSDSYEIEVISLEDILNHISPNLLKMDCEGCEFEIIKNCDMSMFEELLFEYHSKIAGKDHNTLVKKLEEENFDVTLYSVNNSNPNDIGFIHAINKNHE